MGLRPHRLVALVMCLTLLAAPAALANDSAVGTRGAAIRPLQDTDISMQSEAVQIICLRGYAFYRIDFLFVNNSAEDKAVKLGFPFPDFENTEEGNLGNPPSAFRAWHNGTELTVQQERGFDTDGEYEWPVIWFTRETVFPPGESMITVSYLGTPDSSVMGSDLYDELGLDYDESLIAGYYPYLVHTGAGWAGPIEKSVVRYILAPGFNGEYVDEAMRAEAGYDWIEPARAELLSAFTKPAPNVYEWVYEDYEPTIDHDPRLAFVYRSPFSESFDPWSETRASSALTLGEYSYPAYNVRDERPDTAWAESADGPGIGEWVDIPFDETMDIREVRVLPGYQKRADLFAKYNRPSKLRFEFSNGTSFEADLADELGMQTFVVDVRGADSAKVTILGVHQGTNERDETYLSEVSFAPAPMPKFSGYRAMTGFAPPEGFVEPDALAPFTRADDATAEPSDDETPAVTPSDGQPPAGDSGSPLAAVIAIAALLVIALAAYVATRRGKGPEQVPAPDETSSPDDTTPPAH